MVENIRNVLMTNSKLILVVRHIVCACVCIYFWPCDPECLKTNCNLERSKNTDIVTKNTLNLLLKLSQNYIIAYFL